MDDRVTGELVIPRRAPARIRPMRVRPERSTLRTLPGSGVRLRRSRTTRDVLVAARWLCSSWFTYVARSGVRPVTFSEAMEHVANGVEVLGVAVLVLGLVWSAVRALWKLWHADEGRAVYQELRESIGGTLLLGLEILVAADLIKTVAVAPTLENVFVLGLIVVIRTFLSFSLQVEIDGTLPWRRGRASRTG